LLLRTDFSEKSIENIEILNLDVLVKLKLIQYDDIILAENLSLFGILWQGSIFFRKTLFVKNL